MSNAMYELGSDGKWSQRTTVVGVVSAQPKGNNTQIADTTVSWANSAVINTINNVDVVLPSDLQGDALYQIIVTNPSTQTALTAVVKNKETFSIAKYPELTRFGVPASTSDGKAILVQGWMLGEAGRLTLSNDTAIGTTGAFTAEVRVRKV